MNFIKEDGWVYDPFQEDYHFPESEETGDLRCYFNYKNSDGEEDYLDSTCIGGRVMNSLKVSEEIPYTLRLEPDGSLIPTKIAEGAFLSYEPIRKLDLIQPIMQRPVLTFGKGVSYGQEKKSDETLLALLSVSVPRDVNWRKFTCPVIDGPIQVLAAFCYVGEDIGTATAIVKMEKRSSFSFVNVDLGYTLFQYQWNGKLLSKQKLLNENLERATKADFQEEVEKAIKNRSAL